MRDHLEEAVQALGLEDVVALVGHRAPMDYYKASDILVLTSDYEGLPNVILESGALGMCVISTNVGAIGSVLADDRGLCFESFAAADFAQAIIDTYSSGEFTSLGENLRDYVFKFHNQENMFKGYLEVVKTYADAPGIERPSK